MDHPVVGRAEYPGMGPKLSGLDFEIRMPAPLLGQHNTEVYCDELGYTRDDLVTLREMGII